MRIFLSFTLALMIVWTVPVAAQDFDEAEERRIRELALEAILERPEILREAIAILQQRDQQSRISAAQSTLESRRDEIDNDPNAPVLGNPEGDVTIVEFFDYNCPYCKRAAEMIEPLLEEDDGIRLVYREWPILGDGSVFAARAALAARRQDKYEEMHRALMSQSRVSEESTLKAAQELRLDVDQLQEDMKAPEVEDHINASMELARTLGISGTPTVPVGDRVIPGLVPLQQLQEFVKEARAD